MKWSELRYVFDFKEDCKWTGNATSLKEIVAKLRQVDVLVSQGQSMTDAIRQIGVSEVTYYRWRQEFGGIRIEQVKRMKEIELENSRLRKAVSDLTLTSSSFRKLRGET
jgi:putative transposase